MKFMPDIYQVICAKCGGVCCRSYEIFLTKCELEKIKRSGFDFKYYKYGAGWLLKLGRGPACAFLKKGIGCRLKKKFKPLDCDLFPLGFIYCRGKFEFYLLKECAYHKKIIPAEAKKIRKRILLRLKTWSETERETYSRLIAARPKSSMIAV